MTRLTLSEPDGDQPRFFDIIRDYVSSEQPKSLMAGFAYVTTKGAETLVDALQCEAWKKIDKRFIVGINQGITDPQALRILRSQDKLAVRTYVPGKKLNTAALFLTPLFHPKAMLFRQSGGPQGDLLIVSSANLTGSALGPKLKNFECGLATSLAGDMSIGNEFSVWWNKIWNLSRKIDEDFLSKYTSARLSSFASNPDLLSLVEHSEDIGTASKLWIEVGKASGIARHQVEFPVSLASFFGPLKKGRVDLTLVNEKDSWNDRPLTYKKTSYGVDIWRLGMPTIRQGGDPIQHRIILFRRTDHARQFEFEIADTHSAKSIEWLNEAGAFGHLGRTGGAHPRHYGYV